MIPTPQPRRIFLSYAWKDGKKPALRLKADLEKAGFEVWQDAGRIRGGESWTKEIEKGLAWCDTLLAVLTPEALKSDNCRNEQLWALNNGRLVIPVIAARNLHPPIHLTGLIARKYPEELYRSTR